MMMYKMPSETLVFLVQTALVGKLEVIHTS